MTTGLSPHAEARFLGVNQGWYVFWDSGLAYGSIGQGMTHEDAESLAAKVRSGERKP